MANLHFYETIQPSWCQTMAELLFIAPPNHHDIFWHIYVTEIYVTVMDKFGGALDQPVTTHWNRDNISLRLLHYLLMLVGNRINNYIWLQENILWYFCVILVDVICWLDIMWALQICFVTLVFWLPSDYDVYLECSDYLMPIFCLRYR